MARINYDSSDDELPALSEILNRRRNAKPATRSKSPTPGANTSASSSGPKTLNPVVSTGSAGVVQKAKTSATAPRRQRLLKPPTGSSKLALHADPPSFGSIASLDGETAHLRRSAASVKQVPARAARKHTKYVVESDDSDETSAAENLSGSDSESDTAEDVEESLWCGSDGHESGEEHSGLEEILPRKSRSQKPDGKSSGMADVVSSGTMTNGLQGSVRSNSSDTYQNNQHSQDAMAAPVLKRPVLSFDPQERPSSSSSEDQDAVLRYSPPRRKSPHKLSQPTERPCTPPPPSSPSKSRLVSPSKKNRIPTPPHRQSLDAFWSAEIVNTWNDQHSPRKVLQSPRKQQRFGVSDDDPLLQPALQPKSPTKRDPTRKSFEQRKHELAADFLKQLDDTITQGRISSLAAECGGVKLVWSKTLNTTAGRANWKRESLKTQENGTSIVRHRHNASIELAEKVIDDEERLVNVIAHEFCHLANFMISNVRDNPHGKEFKVWAKKVTRAFSYRNINVTTKHSYAIDYKYIWACVKCGHEFKRHSKSIDPTKHRCGSCKAELAQIKPAIRRKDPAKGPSEYQVFMKENFQRIKRENEGKGHKDIMEILGKEYREHKAKKSMTAATDGDLAKVAKAMETIVLDD